MLESNPSTVQKPRIRSRRRDAPIRENKGRKGMRIKHAFLVLTLLGAACAHRSAPANPSAEAQTTLKVENDGVVDMDVFVRSEGQLMRLGFVPGGHTETFPLPASIVPGA